LLSWFCPAQLYEEIEGDLIQRFNKDVNPSDRLNRSDGYWIRRAKRRLMWNAIRFLRPGILLRNKFSTLNYYTMLSLMINNFKMTFRQLKRQKLNSVLHIGGLSLGISVCIVVGLFLKNEWSFDTYHPKADCTYRVNTLWTEREDKFAIYGSPFIMADALKNNFSAFEHITRAHPISKASIKLEGKNPQNQEKILITDAEFIDVFHVQVLQGDARKTLSTPYGALLTRSAAKNLFGTLDVIGKTFVYRNEFNITIGGVIEDFPSNTHLPATMLLSYVDNINYLYSTNENHFGPGDWGTIYGTSTFVVMKDGLAPIDVKGQLTRLADDNINTDSKMGMTKCSFWLQPIKDIHFDLDYSSGPWIKSIDSMWLWFFASIGFIVLFLACINFINLSTAMAITRAKEVGVRKSIGAARLQLFGQFLTESFVLTITSVILSLFIVKLIWPYLTDLINKAIPLDLWNAEFLISLIIGIVVTSLISGFYPALMISKYNPIASLKGVVSSGVNGSYMLRKSLVIVQFTVSAGLIIAVLLIAQQVKFMRNKSLGFDKENIVMIELPDASKIAAFGSELKKLREVKDVSFGNNPPNSEGHWWTQMSNRESDDTREAVMTIWTDSRFFELYGLKLVSGRFPVEADLNALSDKLPQEQQWAKTVVNKKFLEVLSLGSPQEAIGKTFFYGGLSGNAEIIGVVDDFNAQSVHSKIYPLMISQFPFWYSCAGVKLESGIMLQESIASIERSWKRLFPDQPFEYYFLDQKLDASYREDLQQFSLFKIIAGIAILISCLGLWGLSAFTAQQRIKEIGIRKVMGASVRAIVLLLSSQFMLLILISFAISVPVMIYLLNLWLNKFAYHVSVEWQLFAITAAILIGTALLSMSVQTIRAAISNPVKSLRTE